MIKFLKWNYEKFDKAGWAICSLFWFLHYGCLLGVAIFTGDFTEVDDTHSLTHALGCLALQYIANKDWR